jgi:ribosomal protein RSM22 (predicted rRNA methylase)
MLSARKVQKACPNCRAQLLNLFENGFASITSQPQRLASSSFRAAHATTSPTAHRPFSTTRRTFQEHAQSEVATTTSSSPQTDEEIDLIVRQAKHQFGDTLPKGYLNDEELRVYTRHYGPPLRETRPEDVGMPIDRALLQETHKYVLLKDKNILLQENEDGELEKVAYHVPQLPETSESPEATEPVSEQAHGNPEPGDEKIIQASGEESSLPSDAGIDYIKAVAKNPREFHALLKLQRDFERASLLPSEAQEDIPEEEEPVLEEELEEGVEEQEDDGEPDVMFMEEARDNPRLHQYTQQGQWGTKPTTVQLPKAGFVAPIHELLQRTDWKHIREAAEKAFGGVGLPHSVATPQSGRKSGQVPIPMEAGHSRMSEIDADTYIATNLPGMYASAMGILVEIRKRMGPQWLQGLLRRNDGGGPRVLDVGTAGAGLAAWEQVLQTEWDLMHEEQAAPSPWPPGKKTTVVGSDHLRHRISRFLHNTTFLPRLPDYLHSGQVADRMDDSQLPPPRKQYDVIIASHQLMPLKENHKRKAMIDNLWEMLSPEGGILIVVEKGHPRGFEAVADVRQRLLDEFIESPASDPQPESLEEPGARRIREPGMIVAPCTNHKKCPMYLTPGLAHGRKDFCHFSQRFIRPPFLQKVLNAAHRNHEDVEFSFVAIQRGVTPTSPSPLPSAQGRSASDAAFEGYENVAEAPNVLSLPRSIMPPLKRTGHVTLDLCTPAGTIERWTVPKSFSRQAYHDARKAQWGDLWALGAKTRSVRPIRLGKGGVAPDDGGIRARRAAEAAKFKSTKVINMEYDASGVLKANEKGAANKTNLLGGRGRVPTERRTKGGKKVRQRRVSDVLDDLD